MSEEGASKTRGLSKQVIQEIRKIAEEKLSGLKGMVEKVGGYGEIDNAQLIALGIAFLIGLGFGIAIAKRRE
ncbi:MAG: hypothetical protein QXO32_00795 [Candidatus Bathyarchaeia archaeon]